MSKVPPTEENRMQCICGTCPTYKSDACPRNTGEALYCANGETKCDTEKEGCVCGNCPIWKEYQLSSGYFCKNGAAE